MKKVTIQIFFALFLLLAFFSAANHAQTGGNKPDISQITPRLGSVGGFYTFDEMVRQLDSMRLLFPHLISAKDSIFFTMPYPTFAHLRKAIWAVKISRNPDISENEPKLLLISLIHSNEPMGMMQLIYFMWHLLESYQQSPDVRFLLNTREIYFIPILNPDGYIYNQTRYPNGGGDWRLNRQPSWNEFAPIIGIDLNKNFSYGFVGENPDIPRFNPYFRGWSPFYAHETWAIRKFCQSHQLTLNVNYHVIPRNPKAEGFILYPWNYIPNQLTPDSLIFSKIAKHFIGMERFRHGTAHQYQFEMDRTFPQSAPTGTIEDWMYGEKNVKSLTVAIAQNKWPKTDTIPILASKMIPINTRIVWTGGVYPVISETDFRNNNAEPFIRPGESGELTVYLENKGLYPAASAIQLHLTAADTNVVLTQPISSIDSLPANTVKHNSNPFRFTVKPSAPIGHQVTFTLEVSVNTEKLYRDIILITGKPEYLFLDTLPALSNWTASGTWSVVAYDAERQKVITESPDGFYTNNTLYTLTARRPFTLKNYREPRLEFDTRWDIEFDYDFATVSLSTDQGMNWISLRPGYSRFASGEPPVQTDINLFGYDGFQEDWIREKISLSSFEGADSVLIRFQLQTDGWIVGDGWYLDDIRVVGYPVENGAGFGKIQTFHLRNNYPNPFNPTTEIRFTVNQSTTVSLAIYNVLGQKVAQLVTNKHYEPGNYHVAWNGRNSRSQAVSSGVYFYRLEANGKSETKKMMLIR